MPFSDFPTLEGLPQFLRELPQFLEELLQSQGRGLRARVEGHETPPLAHKFRFATENQVCVHSNKSARKAVKIMFRQH